MSGNSSEAKAMQRVAEQLSSLREPIDEQPRLPGVPPPLQEPAGDVEELPEPHSVPLDEAVRIVEAILFASDDPVPSARLTDHVGLSLQPAIKVLKDRYGASGVVLMELAGGFALRTAPDLAYLFEERAGEPKKLSRAALETLAIIAYHQPVTRAEIEDIRGVAASKGTLDVLLETGWVRMRGRRRTPGRPVTYGTTSQFLDQFSLPTLADLPGLDELKGAGLLDAIPPDALGGAPVAGQDAEHAQEDPLNADDVEAERAAMALWPQEGEEVADAAEEGSTTSPMKPKSGADE